MSLPLAARLARRELRGGLRGFRIFLICLALGVAAIAAIGSVRASIEAGLVAEGATLLGGDAEMEFTFRFASDVEKDWMASIATDISEIVDFRSMVVVDRDGVAERGLTQVKAVDANYPLLGSLALTPEITTDVALAGKNGLPGAILHQQLMDQLALTVGDSFRLGTQDFVIMAALTQEPDNSSGGFGLGPRSIVATSALKASGLLTPGTLYTTKYRLLLPDDADLDLLSTAALEQFETTGLRWHDARNGAPGIAMFVERLSAFLILVGLSGLAVGGIGVSAAVRAYLAEKTTVIAVLRSLGADRKTIFQTYFIQIGALSVLGIGIGLILGAVLPLLLAPLLQNLLPIPAVFAIHLSPLVEAALYGVLTALIFTLWPLARTEDVRAATLFRDEMGGGKAIPAPRFVAMVLFLLIILVSAASLFSGSTRLTLWTTGGIISALALLALAAFAIRRLAARLAGKIKKPAPLRWALNAIASPREAATSVVISLGLGLSVLAAVGQIDGNLRTAISGNLPDLAPSYFFIDLQKAQMPAFMDRLEGDPAVSKIESAPMLRGILTRINNKPAKDVAGDHWVVRGDRGITYAATLPATTTLTAGTWWSKDYAGPPLVSFAAEEAAELGLSLGDTLTLNILGRDITATIANFREVDFSTAGMGFVMTLNPAALAGAPHSFIATVYADEQAEAAILRDLSSAFPNITAIRVRDAIDRVSGLLASLAAATSYGASATLLTGFLVLIGAASTGQKSRTYEAAILKTLGASRRRILTSFALRSLILGAAAGSVALLAGLLGGWAVAHYVFETEFVVIWSSAIAIILGGTLATLLTSLAFSWRPLTARPARVLRSQE